MPHGICHLSVVPLRASAGASGELLNQVLFGEHFRILESRKQWSRVQLPHDETEGWLQNEQFRELDEASYKALEQAEAQFSNELVAHCCGTGSDLLPVLLGSAVAGGKVLGYEFEGGSCQGKKERVALLDTAILYVNAPYLLGGRTPFGIDAGGFTQMVYRINGYALHRNPATQAKQGEVLSFIEESEPGDLAFFDNEEGEIIHVGMIMGDNYIIHAHGKVRIDRIDHTGIFNRDTGRYSHQLRMIKKMLP